MTDKYRWTNADICIKCDGLTPTPKGNGLRFAICKECGKVLKSEMKHHREHGLYATPK